MHAAALSDDVADEFVTFLQPAFLVGLVRVAVEDKSSAFAVSCHLDRSGVLEFRPVVSEYDPESLTEDYRPEPVVQIVKYSLNRRLCA